jgi:deoxyribodipyrimidine photo-lyase
VRVRLRPRDPRPLPRADRRVEFIVESVDALDADLAALGERCGVRGVRLLVRHGQAPTRSSRSPPSCACRRCTPTTTTIPYALERDAHVRGALADLGVALHTSKDHVVFERSEVLTTSGKPYSVFTPYKAPGWPSSTTIFLKPYPVERHAGEPRAGAAGVDRALPGLARLGFVKTNLERSRSKAAAPRPRRCSPTSCAHRRLRDGARVPGGEGPELPRRPPALRHDLDPPRRRRGARRIGEAGKHARGAETWLSELIWRDFYQQVLHHLPHVVGASCKPEFDRVASSTAATPTRRSPPGAKAAPAIRWSTRRWRRSTRPAGCTTGCAW